MQIIWNTDFGRNLNGILSVGKNIIIGYDYMDKLKPEITAGRIIECKGYYASYTECPESGKLSITPSISGSHLNP